MQRIDLLDQFLLALHGEGLSATFKQGLSLLSSLLHDTKTGLVCFLNVCANLNVVLLELLLDQLKVLIETISQLEQALVDLGLYLFLQSIAEYLVALLGIFVTVEDRIFQVSDLLLDCIVEKFCLSTDLVGSLPPIVGTLAYLGVKLFNSLMDFLNLLCLDILIVNSPLAILHPEVLVLLFQILDASDQVLLDRRNHLFKAGHLRLDNPIHIIDMFRGRLF